MGKCLRSQFEEGCVLPQLKVNIFLFFYLIGGIVKKQRKAHLKAR